MPGKIPVVLVTGFLGSGKTTLLARFAAEHPDRRMIFLVNELADTSIDALTLATTDRPVQSVVGGSLFCECKAGEFIRVMQEEVLERHREQPIETVVIETSGIADPEAIGELMQHHGLQDNFEVRQIICVVAAKKFIQLLENLPAIRAQLCCSDLIVINKTDLCDEATVCSAEAAARRENPSAAITRAEYCRIPLAAVLKQHPRELPQHPLFTCEANPFSSMTTRWPGQNSIEQARQWLQQLPPSILRIKGSLKTPEGCWHVERTVDELRITPVSDDVEPCLVLIAHDDDEADLQLAIDSLNQ